MNSERCTQVALSGGVPLPERDAVVDLLVIVLTIESNLGSHERPVTLLVVLCCVEVQVLPPIMPLLSLSQQPGTLDGVLGRVRAISIVRWWIFRRRGYRNLRGDG